jgi:YVTN family beta-propeller protein
VFCVALASPALAQTGFVNWENHPIHSLEITPDGGRLLLTNTPDNRLEVFDLAGPSPVHEASIPVGLEPVSVRAWSNRHVWVVNHTSDSVSVVDLDALNVVRTLQTADEPFDVVFAGVPRRAFVSCSQANRVLVFNPLNLAAPPAVIAIDAEDPRALAVSPDGLAVYAAIFESGNGTTILGGGGDVSTVINFPPNVVSDPTGPAGGVNPPPNDGSDIAPPPNPGNPPPPRVGLIVRQNDLGQWLDDNGNDWTSLVSGPDAARSGRPVGWTLPDRDVAIIDAQTLAVRYETRLMNIVMAIGVNPATGVVAAVGTDAINEVRFEPIVNGVFVQVMLGAFDPAGVEPRLLRDLNPHLDYLLPTIPQAERDKSIGDPRGIVWTADGQRGFVSGMGSNNVVVIDAAGNRAGLHETIEVGQGPIGLALDEPRGRLYVHNRFEGSISVVDLATETETERIALFDPTPIEIKAGRPQLYDTHATSGLGQAACASCHVDARMDRLAWDLGNPPGDVAPNVHQNRGAGIIGLRPGTTSPEFEPFHPMKGPMTTQTLQDIISHEPLHWRGDRDGLENFNPAFENLMGDDEQLDPEQMQDFEDFLATIHFPPNPYRKFDNSLPTNLPLDGHHSSGRFSPAGTPLPNGNAQNGLALYTSLTRRVDRNAFACVTCHTLPTGMGTDMTWTGSSFEPIAPGPAGEHHLMLVSVDGSTNRAIKVPHLRNAYEKTGFDMTQTENRAGFGYLHDGSVDSLERFISEPAFDVQSDQEVADLVAFMLAFSGSDLPPGNPANILNPPGPTGQDTHAAVGKQTTLIDADSAPLAQLLFISAMLAQADAGRVGLVAKGVQAGKQRGYVYVGGATFQSDRAAESLSTPELLASAAPDARLTLTVVPAGTEVRIGIDRDADGYFDRDELDACSDPADASIVPGGPGAGLVGDLNGDHVVDLADLSALLTNFGLDSGATPADGDTDGDGDVDLADLSALLSSFGLSCG